MSTRFRDKGFPEENCPLCHKGCLACFDAGKSYVKPVQDELDELRLITNDERSLAQSTERELGRLRAAIAEVCTFHQELKLSETLSYCIMCAERFPCATLRLLNDQVDEPILEGAVL